MDKKLSEAQMLKATPHPTPDSEATGTLIPDAIAPKRPIEAV